MLVCLTPRFRLLVRKIVSSYNDPVTRYDIKLSLHKTKLSSLHCVVSRGN